MPVGDGGKRASQVQRASWTGRETDTDHSATVTAGRRG
jgi:hypothetical protein